MLNLVRSHVDAIREPEFIIDLASHHGHHVEVKSLQVENQVIGDILQAGPVDDEVSLLFVFLARVIGLPFDGINVAPTSRAGVFVICSRLSASMPGTDGSGYTHLLA